MPDARAPGIGPHRLPESAPDGQRGGAGRHGTLLSMLLWESRASKASNAIGQHNTLRNRKRQLRPKHEEYSQKRRPSGGASDSDVPP